MGSNPGHLLKSFLLYRQLPSYFNFSNRNPRIPTETTLVIFCSYLCVILQNVKIKHFSSPVNRTFLFFWYIPPFSFQMWNMRCLKCHIVFVANSCDKMFRTRGCKMAPKFLRSCLSMKLLKPSQNKKGRKNFLWNYRSSKILLKC